MSLFFSFNNQNRNTFKNMYIYNMMSSYIRNLYYYRYFISVRDVFFSHDETHQVTNNKKSIFI